MTPLPPGGRAWNWANTVLEFEVMAGLAQLDWKSLANEAQVRALLEDFLSHYTLPAANQLALAVWYDRSSQGDEHKLLMLFTRAGDERDRG